MNFADAVRTCLGKYATFGGRAARPEYWWFALFNFLGGLVAGALDGLFSSNPDFGVFSALWGLALLLPALAVSARRLHDTDRSAWWLLLYLIPIIGWIILLVWYVTKGTEGPNRFGVAPTN